MKNIRKPGSNFLLWIAIIIVMVVAYNLLEDINMATKKVPFSEFLDQLSENNVKEVVIRGSVLEGKYNDQSNFTTLTPRYYLQLIDDLKTRGVKIDIEPTETSMGSLFGVLLSWFPILLFIGVWIYFMRNMQGTGGKAMGFGKSKARLLLDHGKKVTFADVAGVDEAKEELKELVDFLKDPKKFQKLGGRIPKGCLLIGSPGTGKTLLARAVAGEARVPFFTISGSDFVEMFVGVGASRVRDMFLQAKKHSPCIVFIDEIDAVGRHRGAGLGGGNDEREQTLNQLLVEMDGFAENEGIIVVAATNRPDVLDPALLRPGRFDRQIVVPIPDINGRQQILKVHIKNVPTAPDVNINVIARGTPGFSGADLANLINEAALLAARANRNFVTMQELEAAKDKVMMGAERKSMIITEEDKKITAYHEAGHALVAFYQPESDPIHKATIIPRGRALGLVMTLPENDPHHYSIKKLEARLVLGMGGRVAEEIIFGKDNITSGAAGDIKMVTNLARQMITQWGLSKEIGPVLVGNDKEEVFLGHSIGRENHISDDLAERIDKEIRRFVDEGYKVAKKIITKHVDKLHILAKNLISYETLTGDEIRDLMEGKQIKNKSDDLDLANDQPTSSVPSGGKTVLQNI